MTWELFTKMFHTEYVPLVDRERLAHEYLSLRQRIESVMEIIKMFTERALFFAEYVGPEHVQMSRYLSMLKK